MPYQIVFRHASISYLGGEYISYNGLLLKYHDMITLSILDYSPIDENKNAAYALNSTSALAQNAELLGYKRFWVSEHHGMLTLAGSNPEMLMMHLAACTNTIRIGSGGVMLPHYSAYKVAESIKVMEALHPGRIDLGVGRAPGGDRQTHAALNLGKTQAIPYEQQLLDLLTYLSDKKHGNPTFPELSAMPFIDSIPEAWSLGTSEHSGRFAGKFGMSFIFAHFINPTGAGVTAIKNYIANFTPSALHAAPRTMVATFVAIAETDEKAEQLAIAFHHWLLMIESGRETPYYLAYETIKQYQYTSQEKMVIKSNSKRIIVGTPEKVKPQLEALAETYHTDEIMILPNIFGVENRLKSIELLSHVFKLK